MKLKWHLHSFSDADISNVYDSIYFPEREYTICYASNSHTYCSFHPLNYTTFSILFRPYSLYSLYNDIKEYMLMTKPYAYKIKPYTFRFLVI